MKPRGRQEGDLAFFIMNALGKGGAWLLERVLWLWPKEAATWVGARVIARPTRAVYAFTILMCLPMALEMGIGAELFGDIMRVMWKNEETSRHNLAVAAQMLAKHEKEAPRRTHDYQRAGLGEKEYRRRLLEDEYWDNLEAQAKALKKKSLAVIPSALSPFAPMQEFPPSEWHWKIYYHAHHFLLRSYYPFVLLFYLVVGLVYAWRESPNRKERKWKAAKKRSGKGALLLGLNGELSPHVLTQEDRNHHILVAGTTGSGKTEALGLLARGDIQAGRGLVFFDMKGDRQQARTMLEACRHAGREKDFLFFTSDEGTLCHSYNGAATLNPSVLVDRLMMAGTWSGEPYYSEMARAVLARVIPALVERKKLLTLEDIRAALGCKTGYEIAASAALPKDRTKFEADLDGWPTFYEQTSGLRHNLDNFCQLGERLSTAAADIDFREITGRNRIVYVELNSQMRGVLAGAIARLMLEDFKQVCGQFAAHPEYQRPFSLYIDEARHAVYEGFVGLITQCRSAGIGVVLATQSPLDFRMRGDEGLMRAIVQNTNTKLFFRQVDHESAELCANLAGTVDTVSRTTQLVEEGLFGPEKSGVYSEREVKEYIAHPDRLKRMARGRALLIKGTDQCGIIDVDYDPIAVDGAFAPAIPRAWKEGDRTQLGHDWPPLDFAALIEARREQQRGELAKRKAETSGEPETPLLKRRELSAAAPLTAEDSQREEGRWDS